MRSVSLLGPVVGLVVGVTASGCVPAPVYRVQRTARVPHPAAPLRTGEPLAGPIELSVGASSVGDLMAPELVDRDASLEVARDQMRAELRIRLGKRGEIAPIYEQANSGTMHALDMTQAPVESGAPSAHGFAARYSFATGVTGFAFGVGVEALSWEIPYVEYRSCVANCDGADDFQINHGYESASTLALSLTPTYRSGNLAVFGGAYTRRHPTIGRKGTELHEVDYDQDVQSGRYNWLLNAGVEYRLPIVSFMATVQQNLTRDPVHYGPSFGFAIAFRVPDPPRRRVPDEPVPMVRAPIVQLGPPGAGVIDRDDELPDDPW
jgi:hypothetical protein